MVNMPLGRIAALVPQFAEKDRNADDDADLSQSVV